MPHIEGERVKLVNARFVDVENDRYFDPHVSLVIQGGKIAAMPGLPGQPAEVAADVEIDLGGMSVIPGLFNTHFHLQFMAALGKNREPHIIKHLADCVDRGITNVRDTLCYDRLANQAWVEKVARGETRGPRIHQAIHVTPVGGTYAPRPSIITRVLGLRVGAYDKATSGVVTFRKDAPVREVRDAVDRAIDERGAVAIKLCDQPEHFGSYKPGATVMSPQQLEAAVDQANQRGLPTTMHNVTVAGFRHGVKAGVTSLAHLPIDGSLTEQDAALWLKSETSIEPTLTVAYYMCFSMDGSPMYGHAEIRRLDGYRETSYLRQLEESWLPSMHKNQRAQYATLRSGKIKVFHVVDISAPFRYMSSLVPVGGENLRLLAEHGGTRRFACGTDAGPANCSPAVIDQELGMFDFFLNRDDTSLFTPADALRVATIQSARSMGVADRFGSIRPGKAADLVVIDGDPLRDWKLVGKPVQAVFLDGKLVVDRCGVGARGEEVVRAG